MTSASKVGDLFAAAGEAFAKLSELTRILQTSTNNSNLSTNEENGQSGWSTSDTESLQMAVKRFGDELNVISEHIKDKTMYQIKTTFRKIQPSLSNAAGLNDKSAMETNSGPTTVATFGSHDSTAAFTLASATTASVSSLSSVATTASALETSTAAHRANSSNSATAVVSANTFAQSSSTNAATAASSCSSPSPFLHYPLLRKSADITLNMLNARDDSDDDERSSMSVFNSI